MKKNTMMRIASVLMVAVLLSTCAISGTFAKYVTAATSGDSARVAKWGITMSNNGSATFKDTYDSSESYSVKSDGSGDITDVVAPGTSGGTTYVVSGTPEVDYVITFNGAATNQVFLEEGTYTYPNHYVGMGTTLREKYYPIKYTITISTKDDTNLGTFGKVDDNKEAFDLNNLAETFDTLAEAMAVLNNTTIKYSANNECGLVITLSWEWAFEYNAQTAPNQNDQADTILGDLIAENFIMKKDGNAINNADYNLNIAYTLTMTATQVD